MHDAEGALLRVVREHAALDPPPPAAVGGVVQQALGREEAAAAVGDAPELQPLLERAALVLRVVEELVRVRVRVRVRLGCGQP